MPQVGHTGATGLRDSLRNKNPRHACSGSGLLGNAGKIACTLPAPGRGAPGAPGRLAQGSAPRMFPLISLCALRGEQQSCEHAVKDVMILVLEITQNTSLSLILWLRLLRLYLTTAIAKS